MSAEFNGDKKEGKAITTGLEKKLLKWLVPKLPRWMETNVLTLMTIPWCIIILVCCWMAQYNIYWLIGTVFAILLQHITDLLDGAVGRYRNTGLIKWGYYMDHMLDYLYICCLVIGYSFVVPDPLVLYFMLMIFGAFMVNTYLDFGVTNTFRQYFFGFGPTELKLLLIAQTLSFVFLGKTFMRSWLTGVLIAAVIGLFFNIYFTQRRIWKADMEDKQKRPPAGDSVDKI